MPVIPMPVIPMPVIPMSVIQSVEQLDAHAVVTAAKPVFNRLRSARPLVHVITNYVTTNFTANVLLGIGASPAMVHAQEEVQEFVRLAQALTINIGTLSTPWLESMKKAAAEAKQRSIPWSFDPVAVGSTLFRNQAALDLMAYGPTVIRANAGEIMALARLAGWTEDAGKQKGVDSLSSTSEALSAAQALSTQVKTVVAVTGAQDLIVDGTKICAIAGGNAMSQMVTGTGCALTAMISAFLSVVPAWDASCIALALMKVSAHQATSADIGPAQYAARLTDTLYALTLS